MRCSEEPLGCTAPANRQQRVKRLVFVRHYLLKSVRGPRCIFILVGIWQREHSRLDASLLTLMGIRSRTWGASFRRGLKPGSLREMRRWALPLSKKNKDGFYPEAIIHFFFNQVSSGCAGL